MTRCIRLKASITSFQSNTACYFIIIIYYCNHYHYHINVINTTMVSPTTKQLSKKKPHVRKSHSTKELLPIRNVSITHRKRKRI